MKPQTLAGSVTFHRPLASLAMLQPMHWRERGHSTGQHLYPLPTSVLGSHSAGGRTLPLALITTDDLTKQRDPDSLQGLVTSCRDSNSSCPIWRVPSGSGCLLCPRHQAGLLHTLCIDSSGRLGNGDSSLLTNEETAAQRGTLAFPTLHSSQLRGVTVT